MELGEVAEGLLKIEPGGAPPCARLRALPRISQAAEGQQRGARRDLAGGAVADAQEACAHKAGVNRRRRGRPCGGRRRSGCRRGERGQPEARAPSGGLLTAGVGALATKAVAGLAVAAIVTAGTVEVDHSGAYPHHHRHATAAATVASSAPAVAPVIVRSSAQPASVSVVPLGARAAAERLVRRHTKKAKLAAPKSTADTVVNAAATIPSAVATTPQPTTVKPSAPPVTEVTTDSTALPSTQAQGASGAPVEAPTPTIVTATTSPSETSGATTETAPTTTTEEAPAPATPPTPAPTPIETASSGNPSSGVVSVSTNPSPGIVPVGQSQQPTTPAPETLFNRRHPRGLAVVPEEVPNACEGWLVADGGVASLLVVVVEPVWQGFTTGCA